MHNEWSIGKIDLRWPARSRPSFWVVRDERPRGDSLLRSVALGLSPGCFHSPRYRHHKIRRQNFIATLSPDDYLAVYDEGLSATALSRSPSDRRASSSLDGFPQSSDSVSRSKLFTSPNNPLHRTAFFVTLSRERYVMRTVYSNYIEDNPMRSSPSAAACVLPGLAQAIREDASRDKPGEILGGDRTRERAGNPSTE